MKPATLRQAKSGATYTDEHTLQTVCVRWFRLQYPNLVLFAIPNGGRRDKATAGKLKAEGALAGVADLFLAAPNAKFHGLFIEMKTPVGRQSPEQKVFEDSVWAKGYAYVVCRDLDGFMAWVSGYLANYFPIN